LTPDDEQLAETMKFETSGCGTNVTPTVLPGNVSSIVIVVALADAVSRRMTEVKTALGTPTRCCIALLYAHFCKSYAKLNCWILRDST